MTEKSRELEILVAKIQRVLAPKAKITHDTRLMGRKTERLRQIDVLVEDKIGQYDIRIVIDCKDYKRPVDVKGVEEFWGLVDDVGAHKGVLVWPKGFTEAAKKRAAGLQMELYSPIDTDPHKWQVKATMPGLCDMREAGFSFGISESSPLPFQLPGDFPSSLTVHDENKNPISSMMEAAFKKWEAGGYPTAPGLHRNLNIFDCGKTLIDNGYSQLVPLELKASVLVSQKIYFGQIPIEKISGFKDEQRGKVIMNAFSVGLVSPEEVENTWLRVNEGDNSPAQPVLRVTGLIGYV